MQPRFAGLLLTTEALVVELPEAKTAAPVGGIGIFEKVVGWPHKVAPLSGQKDIEDDLNWK
jgi:hypothetical protein